MTERDLLERLDAGTDAIPGFRELPEDEAEVEGLLEREQDS